MKRYLPLILALLLFPITAIGSTLVSGSFESGMAPFGGPYYGGAEIVSDSTAPDGTHSLRFNIREDTGNSPDIIDGTWSAQNEIWAQMYIKLSSNYTFPKIADKFIFFPTGTSPWTNGFYIGLMFGKNLSLCSQIAWGPGSQNWYSVVGLTPGTWHKLTFHGVANTPGQLDGVGQLWLDDKLIIDVSNIPYRNTGGVGFGGMLLENVFGGPAGTRTNYPYYTYYDSVIVQTTPFTGGVPSPPPPSPSPKIPAPPSTLIIK